MIFSSFRFLVFFPVVLLLYFVSRNLRYRQWLLLIASYIFYASWDPRFLALIFGSTLVDYVVGAKLGRETNAGRRKLWLTVSLIANLGVLGFFKYFNFFADSLRSLFATAGVRIDPAGALHALVPAIPIDPANGLLDLVLPVGISFYTFQTMSYSLDIYRGKLQPQRDFVTFALFVAFFPQLVAGPIVRAVELLPQLERSLRVRWDDISVGIRRFTIGFIKKVFLADNIAPHVDRIFDAPGGFDGVTLWVGAIGFAAQCYCDFSGYTDMAIGCGRVMGFRLPENFRFPFTAVNVADFWRRWHITLYSFMRDYLYFALGGSRVGPVRLLVNAMITMTLVGFWHGADWQFVLWGAYNGVLVIGHRLVGLMIARSRALVKALESTPGIVARVALTNLLFFISFAIFRSASAPEALEMVGRMLVLDDAGARLVLAWQLFAFACVLLSNIACEFELPRRVSESAGPVWVTLGYAVLIVGLVLFAPTNSQAFVYFQF